MSGYERDYSHLSTSGQKRMAKIEAKMQERFLSSQLKVSSDSNIMRASRDYAKFSKFAGHTAEVRQETMLGNLKLTSDMDREVVTSQLADAMVDRGFIDKAKLYFPEQRKRIDTRIVKKQAKRIVGWLFRFW